MSGIGGFPVPDPELPTHAISLILCYILNEFYKGHKEWFPDVVERSFQRAFLKSHHRQ